MNPSPGSKSSIATETMVGFLDWERAVLFTHTNKNNEIRHLKIFINIFK